VKVGLDGGRDARWSGAQRMEALLRNTEIQWTSPHTIFDYGFAKIFEK
jgi:hypothetical protein